MTLKIQGHQNGGGMLSDVKTFSDYLAYLKKSVKQRGDALFRLNLPSCSFQKFLKVKK